MAALECLEAESGPDPVATLIVPWRVEPGTPSVERMEVHALEHADR